MRIFISSAPDTATAQQLTELQSGIELARWTPPEQFHITLRFIGGIGPERLQELAAVLGEIRAAPFDLTIRHVGTFPRMSARQPLNVLWAGLAPSDAVEQLAWTIEDHVQMVGLRPMDQLFHGHVTLARIKEASRDDVAAWLDRYDDLELPPFRVEAFELVNSSISEEGAVYETLREYPLA